MEKNRVIILKFKNINEITEEIAKHLFTSKAFTRRMCLLSLETLLTMYPYFKIYLYDDEDIYHIPNEYILDEDTICIEYYDGCANVSYPDFLKLEFLI